MQTACKTKEGNSSKGEFEEVAEETVELFADHQFHHYTEHTFFEDFQRLAKKIKTLCSK